MTADFDSQLRSIYGHSIYKYIRYIYCTIIITVLYIYGIYTVDTVYIQIYIRPQLYDFNHGRNCYHCPQSQKKFIHKQPPQSINFLVSVCGCLCMFLILSQGFRYFCNVSPEGLSSLLKRANQHRDITRRYVFITRKSLSN